MKKIFNLFIFLLSFNLHADWMNFRGNQSNGSISSKTSIDLTQISKNTWKVKLPGRGLSSPIVVKNKIFLTACSGSKQEILHVLCFNEHDGSLLWERKFKATGRTICHEKTCVAAPTMASDGKKVIAQFSSNDVFCLDLSGDLIWLRGLTYDFPNAANGLGMSSSPLITSNILVTQVENDAYSFTIGLSMKNGKTIWKKERPKAANWTSPVFFNSGNKERIVLQSKDGVDLIDPGNGKVLASFSGGASTIPSTTPTKDILLVPSNGMTALKLSKDGDLLKKIWNNNKLGPGTASPSISGNRFLVINKANVLTCAKVATGEISWRLRIKGPTSGSPVSTKSHLYFFNEDGFGQAIKVDGNEGEVTSSIQLDETILCTPAISNEGLYVRSDDHLWKFPAK